MSSSSKKSLKKQLQEAKDTISNMKEVFWAIRDYVPEEVCKDEFAYDRLVETYREAAEAGLSGERVIGDAS
jgi:hypothetical protein